MKAKLEAAFIGNPEIAALISGINLADPGWKGIGLKTVAEISKERVK